MPDLLFKPQLLIRIPFNILTSGRQTHPFKYPKIESEIAHILLATGFFEFLPNVWEKMVPNFDRYVQWSGDCSSTMAEQILRRSFFRTLLSRCLTCILFPEKHDYYTVIPPCFFNSSLSFTFVTFPPLPSLPRKIEELRQGSCEFGQPKGKVLEVLILDLVDAGYGWFIQLAHLRRTLAVYIREHNRFFRSIAFWCILCVCVCACVFCWRCFLH